MAKYILKQLSHVHIKMITLEGYKNDNLKISNLRFHLLDFKSYFNDTQVYCVTMCPACDIKCMNRDFPQGRRTIVFMVIIAFPCSCFSRNITKEIIYFCFKMKFHGKSLFFSFLSSFYFILFYLDFGFL